jgi:hypothetical protein
VRVAPHTAQASAAGEEIPCRTEHPILVSERVNDNETAGVID